MISNQILRDLLKHGHEDRIPKDEHVVIETVYEPVLEASADHLCIQLSRVRGCGLGAFWRECTTEIPGHVLRLVN